MSLEKKLELNIKLESIFIPHARERRDKAYKRNELTGDVQPSTKFAHYTSADNALKIIRSKEIWLRNTGCMIDYQEVSHGYNILHNFFKFYSALFIEAFASSHPGAPQKALNMFEAHQEDIYLNSFVASVSEHDENDKHGRLSMWRAFGGQAGRVAIILNVPWDAEAGELTKVIFSPVDYPKESEQNSLLFKVIEKVKTEADFLKNNCTEAVVVGWIYTTLLSIATCTKHEGFKEEFEWRAIYPFGLYKNVQNFRSDIVTPSIENISGITQEFYRFPLNKDIHPELAKLDLFQMLDHILIGPTAYSVPMRNAFISELKKQGLKDPEGKVRESHIPIRN